MQEEAFRKAILTSGYPLQIKVAAALAQRDFYLIEEWAYTDADEDVRRALDVFGTLVVGPNSGDSEDGEIELALALLVECKQSSHPLVFFESVVQPVLHDFPLMAGNGPARTIRISPEPASNWSVSMPVPQFLGVESMNFASAPPKTAAMSRAEAKGSKVQVSGDQPYRSLSLPLSKALTTYRTYWQQSRRSRGEAFLLRAPLGIAVVDAPLVIVGHQEPEPVMSPVSWARLIIREPVPLKRDVWARIGYQVIDVVHYTFFDNYLDSELLPFARDLRARISNAHGAVYSGETKIDGLDRSDMPVEPFRHCVDYLSDD